MTSQIMLSTSFWKTKFFTETWCHIFRKKFSKPLSYYYDYL